MRTTLLPNYTQFYIKTLKDKKQEDANDFFQFLYTRLYSDFGAVEYKCSSLLEYFGVKFKKNSFAVGTAFT